MSNYNKNKSKMSVNKTQVKEFPKTKWKNLKTYGDHSVTVGHSHPVAYYDELHVSGEWVEIQNIKRRWHVIADKGANSGKLKIFKKLGT